MKVPSHLCCPQIQVFWPFIFQALVSIFVLWCWPPAFKPFNAVLIAEDICKDTTAYQLVLSTKQKTHHPTSPSFLFPPWEDNNKYDLDQSEAASHKDNRGINKISCITQPPWLELGLGLDHGETCNLSFAITELKLHVLSLVHTTIGFGNPCNMWSSSLQTKPSYKRLRDSPWEFHFPLFSMNERTV